MKKWFEVAHVNRRCEGHSWDRDASQVFKLPVKAIDERIEVEIQDSPDEFRGIPHYNSGGIAGTDDEPPDRA
jgi:hypothetical protein